MEGGQRTPRIWAGDLSSFLLELEKLHPTILGDRTDSRLSSREEMVVGIVKTSNLQTFRAGPSVEKCNTPLYFC